MKAKPARKTATATKPAKKVAVKKTVAKKATTKTVKKTTKTKAEPVTSPESKPKTTKTKTVKAASEPPVAVMPKRKPVHAARAKSLRIILLAKREAIMKQIQEKLGQSLTDDQQRRLESAMDSGDQALFDLEREMGISLQEMRNRERQMIEEALSSLDEGTYGLCGECEEEISEKRLGAMPFARYCIECQSRMELLEKIEKGEQRT